MGTHKTKYFGSIVKSNTDRYNRCRRGIRIRGYRGDREVAAACKKFARWMRVHYEFPIRVPVYLSPHDTLKTMHGETCVAAFFGPWDPLEEPYIRLATGDYRREAARLGRDDALAGYLHSLAHEVVHYQQWVRGELVREEGVDELADAMVDAYALTTDHP